MKCYVVACPEDAINGHSLCQRHTDYFIDRDLAQQKADPVMKMRRKLRDDLNKAPTEIICKVAEFVKGLV